MGSEMWMGSGTGVGRGRAVSGGREARAAGAHSRWFVTFSLSDGHLGIIR